MYIVQDRESELKMIPDTKRFKEESFLEAKVRRFCYHIMWVLPYDNILFSFYVMLMLELHVMILIPSWCSYESFYAMLRFGSHVISLSFLVKDQIRVIDFHLRYQSERVSELRLREWDPYPVDRLEWGHRHSTKRTRSIGVRRLREWVPYGSGLDW